MKVLVMGGTQFNGLALVRELVRMNMLEQRQVRLTYIAETPEAAVERIRTVVRGNADR